MSLDLLRRRRKHLLLLGVAGVSFYGGYKLYHHPSISSKRKELSRFLKALASVVDSVSSSADTINLLSTDLNRFLRSNSDEVPNSLKQFAKLGRSDEFSGSVSRVVEALTVGIVNGLGSGPRSESGFADKLLDKLFSNDGSGFVSVVAGSFAKNFVLAFYSSGDQNDEGESSWIDLICDDKCRELIADCIRIFVSNAVTVYLDKTMEMNTYDEFFSGLTNPKHEAKVKDFLVLVCNGAVETLIKTSHQVLTTSNEEELALPQRIGSSPDERIKNIGKWVDQVSSTLAVPRNRRLVLDVTGRVTFETVKSFLEFVLRKGHDGARRGGRVVREEVLERGLEVVRYVGAKSMLIAMICFALCLHVMTSTKELNAGLIQHPTLTG